MKKSVSLILVFLFIVSVTSFSAQKEWTVMIFLNGDNNLEQFSISDVIEAEAVGSSDKVNILIQFDRAEGYDTSNDNWTDTRIFYVEKSEDNSKINSKPIKMLGEVDMGDWKEAAKFFKFSVDNYPAKKYMFVYWNHGAGWLKRGEEEPVKGISYDDESGNHIDSPDLKKASDEMARYLGRKVDIISFDACLMAMVEIQAQMEDAADVMIGAQETEPADGWPYTPILKAMITNPNMNSTDVGKVAVDEYIASYANSYSWWYGLQAVNQSANYVAKVNEIMEAVDAFAEAIIKEKDFGAFEYALNGSQSFAYSFYKDLVHFAQLVKDRTTSNVIKVRADKVMEAVRKSVFANKWQNDKMKNSNGLSIYVPKANEYKSHYVHTEFAKKTAWDELLLAYYGKSYARETVENYINSYGTEEEESYRMHIVRAVELGNDEMLDEVMQAYDNNTEMFTSLYLNLEEVLVNK
ncbi:MAG: clostripain-related cysteine peptidase [Candidatus Muiribacteriota bacterium]